MFGNLGQLMNIMKNAGQIKQSMDEINRRMEAARFTGEAGGGQVKATVNGRAELVELKIEPGLVAGGDVEVLEDLTIAAVRDAASRSQEAMRKETADMMGGLGLPGMENLLGGDRP